MSKSIKIILVLIVLGVAGFFLAQRNFPTSDVGKLSTYQNEKYGFTLNLPEGATTTNVEDEEGETILVSKAAFDNFQMQIYIMPFDEDIVLTADRIKQDIPDIKMRDAREIKVGETKGVKFVDEDQNTKEIWFVRGGFLYQVSSILKDEKITEEIIKSWGWK